MACKVEGRSVTEEPEVTNRGTLWGIQAHATKSTAPGLNPEETAMILTSLSKGFSTRAADLPAKTLELPDLRGSLSSGIGKLHRVQQINFHGPKGAKLDFMDDAGLSHRFRNESNRVKSLVTKHISIDELRAHFDRPIIDVAKDFGICITLMKKICRRNGIKRWPHRQIRSLSKSIASMEAAMLSAHGSEWERYRNQIVTLRMKRESVIANPNKDKSGRPQPSPASSVYSASSDQSVNSSPSALATSNLSPRSHDDGNVPSQLRPSGSLDMSAVVPTVPTSLSKGGRWTSDEHMAFLEGIRLYGKDWRRVAQVVRSRSAVQTRTHAQKYLMKFAGRLPFEPEGTLKDHHSAQTLQRGAFVNPLVSPTSSVLSSNTGASDNRTHDIVEL